MKKTIKILNELEDNLLAVLIVIMTILAFVNVIARYVFLASFPWVEELNRLGLVILSYMGAAVALKNHAHLGLTILTDRLPEKAQKVVSVFGCIVLCIRFIQLAYYTVVGKDFYEEEETK